MVAILVHKYMTLPSFQSINFPLSYCTLLAYLLPVLTCTCHSVEEGPQTNICWVYVQFL